MKKVLCVVTAVLMLCGVMTLTACDALSELTGGLFGNKVTIVNTWEGTVDMTSMFNQAFGKTMESVTGNVTIEFKEDGTYRMQVDAATLNASLAAGLGMTVEDMEALGIGHKGEETKGEYSYENDVLILDADEAQCELTADTLKITDDSGTSLDLKKKDTK